MKGRHGIILIVALVLMAALILPACVPTPTPTPTPTLTPTPTSTPTSTPGWKEISRWSGNSIKSTEKFTAPNEWRLTWSCNGSGYLDIYVYRSNGDLFKVAASTNEPGSDVSVFHEGGEFYLEIDTTVPYTIVIEGLF